jgi:hypothetical protein
MTFTISPPAGVYQNYSVTFLPSKKYYQFTEALYKQLSMIKLLKDSIILFYFRVNLILEIFGKR